MPSVRKSLGVAALAAISFAPALVAQVVVAPSKPVIGSSNTVSADPTVPRPDTKPCTVTLFSNLEFADYNTKNYDYTPPSSCPGPWSKVVFTADFTVTKGRQYDRSEQFYLGGANLLYGTTAEPRSALSPSWHVENDVTDLTALLKSPQAGTAILGNFVGVYNGVTYDGIIYGTAKLLFYPAGKSAAEATTPDVVIGMPGNGGAYTLNTSTDMLKQTVTLPTNVEKVYLDVISQSQSGDEFWYLCVPSDVSNELESCGGTGYRETEVYVDGTPAGVAPVYPWVYTGGIDPYLWEPIPGVQTLNFKPFRVDLTPFAGLLANGKAHTVGISVFNADSYFLTTGTLYAYTDKGTAKTSGRVVSNTLAAPKPTVTEKLQTDASGNVTGYVDVSAKRKYAITGALQTSHGLVTTTVEGDLLFDNNQGFIINQTEYKQDLKQKSAGAETTTTVAGGKSTTSVEILDYPFTFLYDQLTNADGTTTVTNKSNQKYLDNVDTVKPGGPYFGYSVPYAAATGNEVESTNYLYYDVNGNYTGNAGTSKQNYITVDTNGYCYSATLDSKNLALTSANYGQLCKALF